MRLLIIEDNPRLGFLLKEGLSKSGFAVDVYGTAADGKEALRSTPYDALILDLGLPDEDGLTILVQLRATNDDLPVLILTARDGIGDRVNGLNEGADDYLLKPFAMEELVARVRALLRRPGRGIGIALSLGNLSFDSASREAWIGGQPLRLPAKQATVTPPPVTQKSEDDAFASLEQMMMRNRRQRVRESLEIEKKKAKTDSSFDIPEPSPFNTRG